MADKRIYDLLTTADITDKYLVLDKSGNAEAEKILASDLGGSYTFENGLTDTAGVVTLGGTLNQNTVLDGDANTYDFTGQNLKNLLLGTSELGTTSIIEMDDIGIRKRVTFGTVTAVANLTKNAVNFSYVDSATGGTSAMIANDTFGYMLNENALNDLARLTLQGGSQAYLFHETTAGALSFLDLTATEAYLYSSDPAGSLAELWLYSFGDISLFADAGGDYEYYLDFTGGDLFIEVYDNIGGDYGQLYLGTSIGYSELTYNNKAYRVGTAGMIIADPDDLKGAEYQADYSSNFTARSLIDKGYADATYGGGSSYTFQNGIVEAPAGTVGLGGNLTGDTSIDGVNTHNFSVLNVGTILELNQSAGGSFLNQLIMQEGTGAFIQGYNLTGSTRSYFGVDGSNSFMAVAPVTPGPPFMEIAVVYPTIMRVTDNVNSRGLEYAADYSAAYTTRSLVDKAYVDSVAGGISWSGSTANGIGTYVDANTIQAEANLTYDGSNLVAQGTTSITCLLEGLSGSANLQIRASSGNDSVVRFMEGLTTNVIMGFDDSANIFQIHTASSFTTTANADFSIATSGAIYMGNLGTNTESLILYYNNSTGQVTAAVSSDVRMKEHVKPWERDALGDLVAIPVKEYYHRISEKNEFGVIAQDVEKIIPEMVQLDRDGYRILGERLYFPYFHRAIQQLNEKIESLNDKLKFIDT